MTHLILTMLFLLGLPASAWADDVDITFFFTQPTKNADNTPLTDLKEAYVTFTKDDLSQWIAPMTVTMTDPLGGHRVSFTATLTYPTGSSQEGTVEIVMKDMEGNTSAAGAIVVIASASSEAGPPGAVTAIQACFPP